jgi:hypothetical protein
VCVDVRAIHPATLAATKSCTSRLQMVRQAREKIPEGVKKNEIVADYNEADHALKFPERRGCRASIETSSRRTGRLEPAHSFRNTVLCLDVWNWRIAAANSPPKSPPTASAFRGIATIPSRQIAFKKPRHLSIKVTLKQFLFLVPKICSRIRP